MVVRLRAACLGMHAAQRLNEYAGHQMEVVLTRYRERQACLGLCQAVSGVSDFAGRTDKLRDLPCAEEFCMPSNNGGTEKLLTGSLDCRSVSETQWKLRLTGGPRAVRGELPEAEWRAGWLPSTLSRSQGRG